MLTIRVNKKLAKAALIGGLASVVLSVVCAHDGMCVPAPIYLLCALAWGSVFYVTD
jgi:hypothetical protein